MKENKFKITACLVILLAVIWYLSATTHQNSASGFTAEQRWEIEKQQGFEQGVRDYNSGVYSTPQQKSAQEYLRQKSREDFDQTAKGMLTPEQYQNYREQMKR